MKYLSTLFILLISTLPAFAIFGNDDEEKDQSPWLFGIFNPEFKRVGVFKNPSVMLLDYKSKIAGMGKAENREGHFKESEAAVLQQVFEKFGSMETHDLIEKSHQEQNWQANAGQIDGLVTGIWV